MHLFNGLDSFRRIRQGGIEAAYKEIHKHTDRTALDYIQQDMPGDMDGYRAKSEAEPKLSITFFSRTNGVNRLETSIVDKKIDSIK